jgi:2-amino-4-hydroxy-6-hydroxymethyldihydropteridine diphosphokinase
MQPYRYAIALGSNRRHGRHGGPVGVVRAAMAALERAGLRLIATSPVIPTAALGPAGRSFANAAVIIESRIEPPALLDLLKAIEARFGRRRGRRWGPRVLDLDILLWSGGRWPRQGGKADRVRRLVVPHQSLEQRDFVLRPLARIAPGWRIGRGDRRVRHALFRLDRRAG